MPEDKPQGDASLLFPELHEAHVEQWARFMWDDLSWQSDHAALVATLLDQRSEQHFRWMMEQGKPELTTEDQEWCDKLEDSWKEEWEGVDRWLKPLVRGTAVITDEVERQRRVEELEARREKILADRRKLFETQRDEAGASTRRAPTVDGKTSSEQTASHSKKDRLLAYAKALIDSGSVNTRPELAEKVQKGLPEWKDNDPEYIIDLTRELWPDYTKYKPGRKAKRDT